MKVNLRPLAAVVLVGLAALGTQACAPMAGPDSAANLVGGAPGTGAGSNNINALESGRGPRSGDANSTGGSAGATQQ